MSRPLDKRCSRSSFFGNKPKFHKNLRNNFCQSLLILDAEQLFLSNTQVKTLISQPLLITKNRCQTLFIWRIFLIQNKHFPAINDHIIC